ncbi:MAG TPA: hypothetical protein VJN63_05800, partial [Thermoplasmata archaeon]|nr:hypothetical protein [Thermoplasmata archaeon]
MNLSKVYSAEAAFCAGGLAFIGLAFVSDLSQHLTRIAIDPTHAHFGGDFFLRVNIPAMGVALIAFGLGMYILEHHRNRVHLLAFVAGLLILIDGITHLFALSDHLTAPLQVVFFGVIAPLQITGGLLLVFLPRVWDRYWIVLTVLLIAVYGASRRFAISGLWELEPVEPLGIVSKAIEVLSLFPLVSLVRGARGLPSS